EISFNANIIKIDAFQNLNKYGNSSKIISKYKNNIEIEEHKEFSKYLYLVAHQKYRESEYSAAKDNLDLAFENIEADNNKLKRLLVNLHTLLSKIDN
nr:hypothetical protein [Melioribacteraceae bacterium]